MKYTLITGASGGIGYELAYIFAENKNNLILVARNVSKLEAIKADIDLKYGVDVKIINADLCEEAAAENLYKKTFGLEVENLVNNAGFGDCCAFLESDLKRQKDMIQLNISALTELTHLYGQDMKKRRNGRILNIASIASVCAGPYMSVYYASKSYVLSFTQAVAEELKGSGVSVSALCPGPVDTGFEKAANLENSKMFTYFKPASARAVAMHGYRAMMSRRVIVFHGLTVKLINFVTKLSPRLFARKITKSVNIRRDKTS